MLSKLRYYTIWVLIILILVILPGEIIKPLAAYWYQREGLCYAIGEGAFYASVYNKEQALRAIPVLEHSLRYAYPNWETHFLIGLAYSQLEDYPHAEKAYLESLRFNSGYAKSHYNLGNAYYHTNRYEQAIDSYRTCLKIDPEFAPAQNNLLVAQEMLRRKGEKGSTPFSR